MAGCNSTVPLNTFGQVQANIWNKILDWCGNDEFTVSVIVPNILIVTTFWITSCLYMIVDVTCRPEKIVEYKVQPGTNQPVKSNRLWVAIRLCIFNHIFVQLPVLYLLHPLKQWWGYGWQTHNLPTLGEMIVHYHVGVWLSDATFYYTHRLLHWGPLYKPIHKMHHEWTAPIAVTAHFVHPIEFLISNQLVLFIGPVLTGSHMWFWYIWIVYGVFETCGHHSGYHLPLLSAPEFHEYHHKVFNCNYGGAFFDWLHGTDKGYIGSVDEKRAIKYYDTRPIREIIPDEPKKSRGATKVE